ncbi:MAG: hypothetical protein KGH66_00475 [Candidatus Micrarchaeota archaeon]|nr:hypothetical protein [Candidatus Micrarchaeota archaeon]
MIGEGVENRRPVPLGQVSEILEKGKGKEPTYEQQTAADHAKKFAQKESTEAKILEAVRELKIVTDLTAVEIASIRPQNLMMLKQILAHEKKTFTEEDTSKILAITKEKKG